MLILFGGSFDPIHLGHLDLARTITFRYPVEKFYFVPAQKNPLKENAPRARAEHRRDMVELAISWSGESRFELLDWELHRPAPSYTVTTVEMMRARFPEKPIALLLGNEVFSRFAEWHEPRRILSLADVIVAVRKRDLPCDSSVVLARLGLTETTSDPSSKNRIWHSGKKRFVAHETIDALPYSSSSLRQQISQSWREHHAVRVEGLAEPVRQYIQKNHLYADI